MITLFTVIHIVTVLLLSVMILMQSGKGAEISASFGGSSQTVFGSSGGANFFVKFTAVLAVIFMTTSITLTIMGNTDRTHSVFEGAPIPASKTPSAPAVPAKTSAAPAQNAADPAQSSAPADTAQPSSATHGTPPRAVPAVPPSKSAH